MKVLIATDGTMDPLAAAEAAARLAGADGEVTVFTVVEIPRRLLTDLRAVYGEPSEPAPIDQSIETAGHTTPRPHLSFDWPGDDALLNRYIDDQTTSRTPCRRCCGNGCWFTAASSSSPDNCSGTRELP